MIARNQEGCQAEPHSELLLCHYVCPEQNKVLLQIAFAVWSIFQGGCGETKHQPQGKAKQTSRVCNFNVLHLSQQLATYF